MSTHEQIPSSFTRWESEFIDCPPILPEFKEDEFGLQKSKRELQRLLLGLDFQEINNRLVDFGIPKAAALHEILRTDGQTTVYMTRTSATGEEMTGTYVRVIRNEITNHSPNEREVELEDYLVDLAGYSIRVSRGKAEGDLRNWTIPNYSPPFIVLAGGEPRLESGYGYTPWLPPALNSETTIEEMDSFRQEAANLIKFMKKLDIVSESLRVPYDQS